MQAALLLLVRAREGPSARRATGGKVLLAVEGAATARGMHTALLLV